MKTIQHAVWPTGAPPVSTWLWTQESWDRFAERFRPEGYLGGIHDVRAWEEFDTKRKERWQKEEREAFYAKYGMSCESK